MALRFISALFLMALFIGCTRDDICPEDTATTPLLYIEFRDITDRESTKAVQDLLIYVNNADSTLVTTSAINDTEVLIPLDTELNLSSFLFEYNSTSEEDHNFDAISFNYSREEVYINRACGFKVIYNDLFVDLEKETLNGNWILDTEILKSTIDNENEVHITIFH
ncbi:MAG: hypothetical protein CMC14_13310 [Flavobacteriaceae bacterium]|nr:hypothetical protein [Flavobacteriaceae bacterium]|tara:strand:+ start:98507 stop:99004 length:498 start_codon:yes stop_codon:yes gene_type:complete